MLLGTVVGGWGRGQNLRLVLFSISREGELARQRDGCPGGRREGLYREWAHRIAEQIVHELGTPEKSCLF